MVELLMNKLYVALLRLSNLIPDLNTNLIATDMASIIFWKIVPTPEKSVQAYGARFELFGKYDGLVFFVDTYVFRYNPNSHLSCPCKSSDGFQHLCLKLEPLSNTVQLCNEISALETLKSCEGVPHILYHGMTEFHGKKYCALVTGNNLLLLGSFSLDRIAQKSLHDLPSHSIDILQITTQVISILQNIHKHGLSHNDIKPDHIVFDSQGLFLIDFGACTQLGSEIPFTTQKFCPNRALLSQESVCLVFYICSHLPGPHYRLWHFVVFRGVSVSKASVGLPIGDPKRLIMKLDYQPNQCRWRDSHLWPVAEQISQLLDV
jgi:serine/threonine protein kinase